MKKVKDVAKDTVEVVGDVTMKVVEVVEEVVEEVRRRQRDTVLLAIRVWRTATVADVRSQRHRHADVAVRTRYLAAVLAVCATTVMVSYPVVQSTC